MISALVKFASTLRELAVVRGFGDLKKKSLSVEVLTCRSTEENCVRLESGLRSNPGCLSALPVTGGLLAGIFAGEPAVARLSSPTICGVWVSDLFMIGIYLILRLQERI